MVVGATGSSLELGAHLIEKFGQSIGRWRRLGHAAVGVVHVAVVSGGDRAMSRGGRSRRKGGLTVRAEGRCQQASSTSNKLCSRQAAADRRCSQWEMRVGVPNDGRLAVVMRREVSWWSEAER